VRPALNGGGLQPTRPQRVSRASRRGPCWSAAARAAAAGGAAGEANRGAGVAGAGGSGASDGGVLILGDAGICLGDAAPCDGIRLQYHAGNLNKQNDAWIRPEIRCWRSDPCRPPDRSRPAARGRTS